jgi:hypothetical protein
VLTSRKDNAHDKKSKDYEITKWEADLRKSLANKQASTTASLTKEEQGLVKAQLEKEARIRQRVALVKANLERGLRFIHSLVMAGVDDFRSYVPSIASLLLDGALGRVSTLVGSRTFDTYLV